MPKELKVGDTGVYLHDDSLFRRFFEVRRIAEVPYRAAMSWVKEACPEVNMGCGTKAADLDYHHRGSQWLNKLYVVVEVRWDAVIALYNHDGTIYVYAITPNKE